MKVVYFFARTSKSRLICVLYFIFSVGLLPLASSQQDCYDAQNRAQKCDPPFKNAAFGLRVEATNTCGIGRQTEYCVLSGFSRGKKQCLQCDANTPGLNHPAEFMTDSENSQNRTWWQSESMLEGIQYPDVVNLTVNLGKQYDVTYIRLRFQSPRPESFAIYKKITPDDDWIPFQFYSSSCEATYNKPTKGVVTAANQGTAFCSDEYSDISPLTGGNVAFSTLVGRPGAWRFETSKVLQQWVKASAIRIVLTRLNTFGDEQFGEESVLKSYYYAISDLSVGARCFCNGHAKRCVTQTSGRVVCECEHNTAGDNCEKCRRGYDAVPWRRATDSDAFECQKSPDQEEDITTKTSYSATDKLDVITNPANSQDSTNNEDPTTKEQSNDSTTVEGTAGGGIVWIVVGIVVSIIVLIILGAVIVCQIRKKRNKQSIIASKDQTDTDGGETANEVNDPAEDTPLQLTTNSVQDEHKTMDGDYEETRSPDTDHVYTSLN